MSQRILEGGHHVPAERILQRYPRTMAHLKTAVRIADMAFVYDAVDVDVDVDVDVEQGAHAVLALCEKEHTTVLAHALPPWATVMLTQG